MSFFFCKCSQHARERQAMAANLKALLYLAIIVALLVATLWSLAHVAKDKFRSAGHSGEGSHSVVRVRVGANAKVAVG